MLPAGDRRSEGQTPLASQPAAGPPPAVLAPPQALQQPAGNQPAALQQEALAPGPAGSAPVRNQNPADAWVTPTKWPGRLGEAYKQAVAQLGGPDVARPRQLADLLLPHFQDLTYKNIRWRLHSTRRRAKQAQAQSQEVQQQHVLQQQQHQQHQQQQHAPQQATQQRAQQQEQSAPPQHFHRRRPSSLSVNTAAAADAAAAEETAAAAAAAHGGSTASLLLSQPRSANVARSSGGHGSAHSYSSQHAFVLPLSEQPLQPRSLHSQQQHQQCQQLQGAPGCQGAGPPWVPHLQPAAEQMLVAARQDRELCVQLLAVLEQRRRDLETVLRLSERLVDLQQLLDRRFERGPEPRPVPATHSTTSSEDSGTVRGGQHKQAGEVHQHAAQQCQQEQAQEQQQQQREPHQQQQAQAWASSQAPPPALCGNSCGRAKTEPRAGRATAATSAQAASSPQSVASGPSDVAAPAAHPKQLLRHQRTKAALAAAHPSFSLSAVEAAALCGPAIFI